MKIRTYTELSRLESFGDRLEYLKLYGNVGVQTFGFDRHLNQTFYTSSHWRQVRDFVITRDCGCDLGVIGYEIYSGLYIHHMTPITPEDIINREEWILDPEFLITTSHKTHNAIHYTNDSLTPQVVMSRSPNDTKLW